MVSRWDTLSPMAMANGSRLVILFFIIKKVLTSKKFISIFGALFLKTKFDKISFWAYSLKLDLNHSYIFEKKLHLTNKKGR